MWNKCAVLLSASLPEALLGHVVTLDMREKEESPGFLERREKLESREDKVILDLWVTKE